ncbi:uncharacterized protein yc1106_07638 [Curvularia clavata]|uniref:Protein NO VEIN C-terminal domain-containing protein n=1 Tax=Curvularia clavata TaxID=95742 RepID=A0A9Q9DVZ9_CURCL|nr:uncharacterized protein yc1106_07638 [Curvularia clavata]
MTSKPFGDMRCTSDLVTTTDDARKVIEEIAQRKGAFTDAFRQEAKREAEHGRTGMLQAMVCGEEIREDFSKLLKIISKDLYTSDARFLMEVIQNADDNKYDGNKTPTVSIKIFPEHIKIECNEVGFSNDNVQALCRTGRSSKPPGQGYTGEKGIGFKSVFKIANRAHIRSHPYYFELDQRRDLGMITPTWDEDFFSSHEEEHQTTIVLDHICNGSKNFSTSLKAELDAIDPVLILFLRRIERLHLILFKSSNDDEPAINKCFRRVDWTTKSGFVSLKDENTNTQRRFYKQKFTANFRGTESRRPGVTEVDVVLAFPVQKRQDRYHPMIKKDNHTFAWLPLMDCGFKFILQSDFLTTSNRQSVDEDSDWNKNIADAIPFAMEAAIDNFNQDDSSFDELAKMWPLYLETYVFGLSSYWRNITKSMYQHLSNALVVKDQTGRVRRPTNLMFMDWAHDHESKPMFGSERDYISSNYPSEVREALSLMGVTAPTWKWLCKKLRKLHSEELLEGKMQSAQWCSDLARIILESRHRRGSTAYTEDLGKIPLIPLSDGTWRCAPSEDDPIYFPASEGTSIPPGLPLTLVEERASNCPERRKLFQYLGVKDCNVLSVIERILDYHAKLSSTTIDDVIAQVQYLCKFRDHLRPRDMRKIYFASSVPIVSVLKGASTYADISPGGELKELFTGCDEVRFLDDRYFLDLKDKQKATVAEWFRETAGVALAPRFISSSGGVHPNFEWLLANRRDRILVTLRQYWNHYKQIITPAARDTIGNHRFLCISGSTTVLHKTLVPLCELVEKTEKFAKADQCDFLSLPNGEPEDWIFLSKFGINLKEGLDYYLWVLCQSGFQKHADVVKSKDLFLAIQSCCFSPDEVERVKETFADSTVALLDGKSQYLTSCVWIAPKGFSSKPALFPIYGNELNRFFVDILGVPNVTSVEAQEYLEKLKGDLSTTLAQVMEVYVFLQTYHPYTCDFDDRDACIAVPSMRESNLEWKMPAECVWGDREFSENELQLESKTALRSIVRENIPDAEDFFTRILMLPNAGINELLTDLVFMQTENRDDSKRVYQLYERIQYYCRSHEEIIEGAFRKRPLIYLRGFNNENGRWLSLKDCVWTGSTLRNKHTLKPSLDGFRGLFRDTLKVPNTTIGMLVTELLQLTESFEGCEDDYQYIKTLLKGIANLPQDNADLERLYDECCWPCRNPKQEPVLCSIGDFYVNDRQNLFNIFADHHTFLDFNFEDTKSLAVLLRGQGCESFLSENVAIETACSGQSIFNRDLTDDICSRADSLVLYFEHLECTSPYELRSLLENAEVWESGDIETHYELGFKIFTKSEGGSHVEVCEEEEQVMKLKIHVSTDIHKRDCALIIDFPEQLVSALELRLDHLSDLCDLLRVPSASLKALMVRRGFSGEDSTSDYADDSVATSADDDSGGELESSDESDQDGSTETRTTEDHNYGVESTVEHYVRSSAMARTAHTSLRPNVRYSLSSSPEPSEAQSHDHLDALSESSLLEEQITSRPAAAGIYSADNRSRNVERIQRLARGVGSSTGSRSMDSAGQSVRDDGIFDLNSLSEALDAVEPLPIPTLAQAKHNRAPRAGPIPQRNEEQRARDFEVGFLGEQFVYTLLHDIFRLPGFTGEHNWTSSLRTRAGFSAFGREISDFTYSDSEGALTRQFLQMHHHHEVPEWLATYCNDGNVPLYRIEVKSTTSRDANTAFYMSGAQYELAKRLRVTSTPPSEVYVIFRISGLDALEEGASHQPQWRVYLDPHSQGLEGLLRFNAPTYVVTPAAQNGSM